MIHPDKAHAVANFWATAIFGAIYSVAAPVFTHYIFGGREGLNAVSFTAVVGITVVSLIHQGVKIDWDNLDEPNPPAGKPQTPPRPRSAVYDDQSTK